MNTSTNPNTPEKPSGSSHAANTPTSGQTHQYEGKGIIGAVFLIFLGTVFLLNTTQVLPWSVWNGLWRFWPVILILIGIQIFLGTSVWGRIVTAIVALGLFVLIAWFVLIAQGVQWVTDHSPSWADSLVSSIQNGSEGSIGETMSIAQSSYTGITKQNLVVKSGDARIDLRAEKNTTSFLRVDSERSSSRGKPEIISTQKGNVLEMTVTQNDAEQFIFRNFREPKYEITLGAFLPTSLNVEAGAAAQDVLDLRNISLQDLVFKVGAGDATIRVGEALVGTPTVHLEIGAGSVALYVPKSVGYELTYEVGAGRITYENKTVSGLGQNEKSVRSSNYDTATKKLIIQAQVGAGSITIHQEDSNE